MKKIFYIALIALTGLFAVSCEQEHLDVIYNPNNSTAQVLESINDVILDADSNLSVVFTPANFGISAAAVYSFFVSNESSMADKTRLTANITVDGAAGLIKVSQKDLNSYCLNKGATPDEEFTLYFQLVAYIMNDKGQGIESTAIASNVVSAKVIPYNSEIKDVDKYAHVWVIGASSAVGAWSFDKVYQYLYDYDGTGNIYSGVIDFGEEGPSGGFKITGVGSWDEDSKNWGSEAQAEESEAAVVNMISGGGSKDIKCYSYRYYGFSFDSNALVLTKLYGFNNVGIVGAFNDWNPGDANAKMAYNANYHRFYIDWTFDSDTELKFTCDDAWDINWGVDCVPGGSNIPVQAGAYRIYLDLNTKTYDFNAGMFGKEEPTGGDTPEPPAPTYQGWGLIGDFNDWSGDVEMTENAGVWTGYLNLTTAQGFKIRKDADWAENYGGVLVALDEPFEAVAGGDDIFVPADGFYKVEFDSNALTFTVSNGEVWSLIGGFNDWAGDVDMTLVDGKWVSPATEITGEFKIRHNHGWDDNRGGVFTELGVPFDAVAGGDNIVVESGLYKVVYDPEAEQITIELGKPENLWSIIGSIAGTSWDTDLYMTENADGTWIYEGIEIADGDEFKIRFNNDWGVNRGGDFAEVGVAFAASQDGPNIKGVPAGKYDVIYNPADETITIVSPEPKWSIIGSIAGTSWDTDLNMTKTEEGLWIYEGIEIADGDEFKIRFNNDWGVNRGGDFAEVGVAFAASQDGPNIKGVPAGKYDVIYNPEAETITIASPEPKWAVIGAVGGTSWDTDFVMKKSSDGTWTYKGLQIADGDEFKIRLGGAWDTNRGGEFVEAGVPFAVSQDGPNIKGVPAGIYDVVYAPADETMTIFAQEKGWSIIGAIAGTEWNTDFFMTKKADGTWIYEGIEIAEGNEFKIRYNENWDINRGGVFAAVGEPFAVTNGGDNIKGVPAGKYNVIYNPEAETITIAEFEKGWSIIGAIAGTEWNTDFFMTKKADGTWIYEGIEVAEGNEFKIRYNENWDINRGGTFAALDEPFAVTNGGDNIKGVPAGKYNVIYNPADETITITPAEKGWALIGAIAGTSWDTDFRMTKATDGTWVYEGIEIAEGNEFKLRYNNDWDINRGGTFAAVGEPFAAVAGGDNIKGVPAGTYKVIYDPANEIITIAE